VRIEADMTRRRLPPFLRPRIAGLTLLAVALTAAMTFMGFWQLDAYNERQDLASAEIARAKPVPLDTLLGPDQAFTADAHARPVIVEGEYDDRQFLVDRPGDGTWVATPLVTGNGSAILVVRGVAPTETATPTGPATPPAPTTGPVRVVGSLQPSEGRGDDPDPRDDRVPTLSTAQLVSEVDHDLYSGYVVLTDQSPPSTLPAATPPRPDTSVTTGLRNLMYALQWWLFGGFVVFMWWRIVRDEARVA
jgi:cytochrome oxidase assembly protein ShyY1